MTMQWTAVDEPCRFMGSRDAEFATAGHRRLERREEALPGRATRKKLKALRPVNYDDGEAAANDGVTTTVPLEDDVAAGRS